MWLWVGAVWHWEHIWDGFETLLCWFFVNTIKTVPNTYQNSTQNRIKMSRVEPVGFCDVYSVQKRIKVFLMRFWCVFDAFLIRCDFFDTVLWRFRYKLRFYPCTSVNWTFLMRFWYCFDTYLWLRCKLRFYPCTFVNIYIKNVSKTYQKRMCQNRIKNVSEMYQKQNMQ